MSHICRQALPRQREVMLINDTPVKLEAERGEAFSAVSNMNFITSLRKGRVNVADTSPEGYKGILATRIHPTYLDVSPYTEGNGDFRQELKKRKDLQDIDGLLFLKEEWQFIPEKQFFPIPHQKDGYIAYRLYMQLTGLLEEIKAVQPKLILLTGKWTTFLLCGVSSIAENMPKAADRKPLGCIAKYRSSILTPHVCWELPESIVVPIIHTINAFGMQDKVSIMEMDLQRVGYMHHTLQERPVSYYIKPSKSYHYSTNYIETIQNIAELLEILDKGVTYVTCDIETFFNSVIDCIGFSYTIDEGFCIPFCHKGNAHIWTEWEEKEILLRIKKILTHRNIRTVFQNGAYDLQYIYQAWGWSIRMHEDTMVLAHILYNCFPKDLAFLASMYVEHYTYWKGDITATEEAPETRWIYNCKDNCFTLEVLLQEQAIMENMQDKPLADLYRFQMDDLQPEVLHTMYRGVRIDQERKQALYTFFRSLYEQIPTKINEYLGFEFNANSHIQKKKLLEDYFGIELKYKKVKGSADVKTCDSKAMKEYIEEYPMYAPFLTLLLEYTALVKFTNTFLGMLLDTDGRARTFYGIAGTKTGRFASKKNVWRRGCMPVDKAMAYTREGWVSISEKPEEILQYTWGGTLEFVKADWTIYDYTGELYTYRGRCFRGDFTPDHRIVKTKRDRLHIQKAEEVFNLKGSYSVPVSGELIQEPLLLVSDNWLQKLVMLSADGSQEGRREGSAWRISVKKQRKQDRIHLLCGTTKEDSDKCREGYIRIRLQDEGFTKTFPSWILDLSLAQRILFIEELQHWDAHVRGNSFMYFTTIPENAELVHTICHLSGYSASVTINETNSNEYGNTSTKPLYTVNVSRKANNTLDGFRWGVKEYKDITVGCPTVPSSMWLVKYDGGIHVTGNCNFQNIPEKGKLPINYILQALDIGKDEEEDALATLALLDDEDYEVEDELF